MAVGKNVLGTDLQCCCQDPMTGFYRTGFCETGAEDRGLHIVCIEVTDEFLSFSQSCGNDLSTPMGAHFPGLEAGDHWCLCALRWKEAYEAGAAPLINLQATHISTLEFIDLEVLQQYALPVV
ncbi:MAG: DUF2237 domain-containing protein [Planctomycetes bacterium]|nr:DUF2237 domain-containing protein [Planctomycetota bacterium]